MEIKLEDGLIDKTPIIKHVNICFTAIEYERWRLIRHKLQAINPKLKIQEYARISLRELMDQLEDLIDRHGK